MSPREVILAEDLPQYMLARAWHSLYFHGEQTQTPSAVVILVFLGLY